MCGQSTLWYKKADVIYQSKNLGSFQNQVLNTNEWEVSRLTTKRTHNVGTHLMGTAHNIHPTPEHNEHLTHSWRTQRPYNLHETLAQPPCTVGTQTSYY